MGIYSIFEAIYCHVAVVTSFKAISCRFNSYFIKKSQAGLKTTSPPISQKTKRQWQKKTKQKYNVKTRDKDRVRVQVHGKTDQPTLVTSFSPISCSQSPLAPPPTHSGDTLNIENNGNYSSFKYELKLLRVFK